MAAMSRAEKELQPAGGPGEALDGTPELAQINTYDSETVGVAQEVAAGRLARSVAYRRLLRANTMILTTLRLVLAVVVVFDLVIVLANILARQVFHHSLEWETAYSQLALLAIGFIGGAIAFCSGEHITIDSVVRRLGARTRARLWIGGQWLAIWFAVLTLLWAIQTYPQSAAQTIAGVNLSEGIFAAVLTVAMAAIVVNTVVQLPGYSLVDILWGLGFALIPLVLTYVGYELAWVVESPAHALLLATVLTVVIILCGVPLSISLLGFVAIFTVAGRQETAFVPLGLEGGIGDFVLLAVPFFVLAGYLMTQGGLGKAIVNLFAPLLRRLPGGSLQLTVVTMFVFSGMTGAKIADVTAVGTAMSETLAEEGYDRAEVASVLAACASAGEIVPPSIALLILGTITSVSIGTLLIAGIVPAILVALVLCVAVALRDRRRAKAAAGKLARLPGEFRKEVVRGVFSLGLPILLLAGIETGYFTPTEAAAVSVLYAVVITSFSRDRLSLKQMWKTVELSATTSGLLLLIIAIAATVGNSAALAQVPQSIAAGLAAIGDSRAVFLILTIVIVPIAGALLEGIPAILIFAPLLVPTAGQLGINLVHYGIVFVLSLGIGAFSPLLGIGFYTACKVTGAEIGQATKKYFPYFCALLAGTAIVAFLPEITVWLPKLFHYAGV